jgi:GPH family glycoside/pentoside/hexuronide:cation symporter
MSGKNLTFGTKLGFGVCDIGGNLFFTVMSFWLLNYLTDTVKLSAVLAGTAVMAGRIIDAVSDPFMGYISDHTHSIWGRRRPYIFIGSILLFITMAVMFNNPHIPEQTALFWWAAVSYTLLYLAYTVINIPYSSLTPELTGDYNERTVLNGFRMSCAIVGTFIGAGAALPLINAFSPSPDKSGGYFAMGLIFGGVMLISAMITVFSIKEKAASTPDFKTGLFMSYLSAFKNRPFLLILLPWTFTIMANTLLSGMLIYYFKYIYKAESMTTMALLILLACTMVFIPVWVLISRLIGKKAGLCIGLAIMAAGIMTVFFFAHILGMTFFLIIIGVIGIGLSTTYVFPWSIVPDTVEYDYSITGERREGVYYGLWTFSSKLGQALAGLMMGFLLGIAGYNLPVMPLERVQFAIRLIVGPISAFIYLLAIIILLFYPITGKKYREILASIRTSPKKD